jgi:hypothetical protein
MFEVRDQLTEDFWIVVDVAESGVAAIAEPSPEAAGLVTMVEENSAVSPVPRSTDIAHCRAGAPSQSFLFSQAFCTGFCGVLRAVLFPPLSLVFFGLRFPTLPLRLGQPEFTASGVDFVLTLIVKLSDVLSGFWRLLLGENFLSVLSVVGLSSRGISHAHHLAWEKGIA